MPCFFSCLRNGSSQSRCLVCGLADAVAAGDVTHDSAVLWAHGTNLGPVTFAVSTNGDSASPQVEVITNATDATLPVKVAVSNLTAATTYYYRATDLSGQTASGTFRSPG